MSSTQRGVPTGSAVLFAALLVAVVAIAVGKKTGLVDYDLAKRGVGVVLGAMLVAAGNLLPKFRLLDSPRREPAGTLAAERTAGRVFVVAGVAYAACWAWAPTERVMLVSSVVGLAAFGLVGLVWALSVRPSPKPADRPAPGQATLARRFALATILLTLGWGSVLFLVDHLWGDAASQWVGMAYAVALPAVLAPIALRINHGSSVADK